MKNIKCISCCPSVNILISYYKPKYWPPSETSCSSPAQHFVAQHWRGPAVSYSWTLPAGLSDGGCLRGHSEAQPPSPPAAVALIHYGTAVSGTGQWVREGEVLETFYVCSKKDTVVKSTVLYRILQGDKEELWPPLLTLLSSSCIPDEDDTVSLRFRLRAESLSFISASELDIEAILFFMSSTLPRRDEAWSSAARKLRPRVSRDVCKFCLNQEATVDFSW